ncbi:MAG: hypothetical protein JJ902_22650 [Roseibium sp.]|nr:hypothetical protein [Roseibium sp.]
MKRPSAIEIEDARRTAPPAADRAMRFLDETGALVADLQTLQGDLKACLDLTPHDRARILTVVDTFKTKALNVHCEAIRAVDAIRNGR